MLQRSSSITGKFQGEIQLPVPSSVSKHINMFYMISVPCINHIHIFSLKETNKNTWMFEYNVIKY